VGLYRFLPCHQCLPGFFYQNVLCQFRATSHEKPFLFLKSRKFARYSRICTFPFINFPSNCEERMRASSYSWQLSSPLVSWGLCFCPATQTIRMTNLRVLTTARFENVSDCNKKSLAFPWRFFQILSLFSFVQLHIAKVMAVSATNQPRTSSGRGWHPINSIIYECVLS